jgi:hypothetical protein
MPSETVLVLCVLFESVSVLFVLLGIPVMRRARARSARAGASDVAAGQDLIAIGISLASLAFWFLLVSTPPAVFAFACSGWLLVGTTGILLHGTLVVNRGRTA